MDLGEVDEDGNPEPDTISELIMIKLEKFKGLLQENKKPKSNKTRIKSDDDKNIETEIDEDEDEDEDEN